LCAARRAVEEARVLEQVYRQRYQQRLAPYLERVEAEGRRWLAALSDLLAVVAVEPPPAFAADRRRMLSREDGRWQDFEKARRRHDQAWAVLLGQCGLPAPPGSVTKAPSAGQTAPAGVSENSPAG
ncbi:MAG: DUF3080 family protein, partial [Candidatus Competibacteraceae bacterium]|nr:DUF3080 family protein [Candidatus Competibacteraceae bacterium]